MDSNILSKATHFLRLLFQGCFFLIFAVGCRPLEGEIPTPTGTDHPVTIPTDEPQISPTPASIGHQVRLVDGMTMVYVPAGSFEMGNHLDERACPVHEVSVGPFWIDQFEVTNAMYTEFLNELGNQLEEDDVAWLEPGIGHRGIVYGYIEEIDGVFHTRVGYEQYPVVEVSWYGAAAYCSWVGGRLPTEAEWEYAARGPESLAYPWGDTYDGSCANYCDILCNEEPRDRTSNDGAARWTAVGSYPECASWCGAQDMAGNVWEWVNDWWSEDYYAHSPSENPQGPASGTLHIGRGGSWYDLGSEFGVTFRKGLTSSSYRIHWIGFRCVVPFLP